MTLRHFQIFIAVCEKGSMTAAAQALFLSQPAVSQTISDMEQHYGVPLFERLSRRLYLTQAGKRLLGYARHIIRMNCDAEMQMKSIAGGGTIRVGASVTVGAQILPALVSRFIRENPLISVEVTEDNTSRIEKGVLSDQIDIGLVEGETRSSDLVKIPFLKDELVLICAADHRFAGLESVEPSRLEKEEFILREQGSGTRKTFEEVMAVHGIPWRETWTCNNMDTIKNAVASGLGISVISSRTVESERNAGKLWALRIDGVRFLREFRIIYHKDKYVTQALERLISAVQKFSASGEFR